MRGKESRSRTDYLYALGKVSAYEGQRVKYYHKHKLLFMTVYEVKSGLGKGS